jgi:hypothetical protein
MFRRFAAMMLAILIAANAFSIAAASQNSAASQDEDIPEPWECEVRPAGILSILAVLNEIEDAQYAPPVSSIGREDIEQGNPVSQEDMEGITETTRELVACVNARDVLRTVALLTERFQARIAVAIVDGEGLEPIIDQLPVLVSETDSSGEFAAIPIADAWYPAGTNKAIQAILEPNVEGLEEQQAFLVTFVFSIDRWLIDDIQRITDDASAEPAFASPTPETS